MSIRLLVEEMYCAPKLHWKVARSLLLLIGVGALSYSGWSYLEQFIHERGERNAFDRARVSQTPASSGTEALVPPEPFRAKLVIARLNLSTMVEEGVGESTLRHAAGHIPTTALPGQLGNIGVAAHRDTLFRNLKEIKTHDRIVLSTLTNEYNYEVTATSIVRPNDISVLAPTPGEKTLTLVTCYPFYYVGPAPKRFVVQARQISVTRP
jgi:sortase A